MNDSSDLLAHYSKMYGEATIGIAELMVWIFHHHDHIDNPDGSSLTYVDSLDLERHLERKSGENTP